MTWSAGLCAAAGLVTAAAAAIPSLAAPTVETPAAVKWPTIVRPALPSAAAMALLDDVTFVDPLPGRAIDSPFGLRQLPWEEHARLHAGVDIAAPLDTPIGAVRQGVVSDAGEKAGYGRFVEVRCDGGLIALYAHLRGPAAGIKPGAAVRAGDVVGYVGNTGDSTGPHLHLEIHDGDDHPLNPAMFLGKTFASADKVPVRAAARIGGVIRIAAVSHIPASKRALMAERLAELEGKPTKAAPAGAPTIRLARRGERPHMLIPAAAPPPDAAPPPVITAAGAG